MTKQGLQHIKLADYVPILTAEITRDDGTEQKKLFCVSAIHASGVQLPEVTVSAEEISSMKWTLIKWRALGVSQPKHNV